MKKIHLILIVCLALLYQIPGYSQWATSGFTLYNTTVADVNIGQNNGINDANVQIGQNRSADGHAYFDLVADGSSFPDFGTRLIRYGKGATKGHSRLEHRGIKPFEFKVSDNGSFDFLRSGDQLTMRINGAGQVSIGTADPGNYQLAVEGTIGTRKVEVTLTTPFPDYVFKPDYDLMPLNELKAFINKHHHLPEIPSAKEVEQKGSIELGKQYTLLLKKVEELTLYTLAQEERIKDLELRLKQQEKE